MEQLHNAINDAFLEVYKKVYALEKQELTVKLFPDITLNDVHIIDETGIGEPKNMSEIAKALSVTVGSLTTAMNGLVRKGYVVRERGSKDRRVVYIRLTEQGEQVFLKHRDFHQQSAEILCSGVGEQELTRLTELMHQAAENMKKYMEENETVK